jgi:hypothetical protein
VVPEWTFPETFAVAAPGQSVVQPPVVPASKPPSTMYWASGTPGVTVALWSPLAPEEAVVQSSSSTRLIWIVRLACANGGTWVLRYCQTRSMADPFGNASPSVGVSRIGGGTWVVTEMNTGSDHGEVLTAG